MLSSLRTPFWLLLPLVLLTGCDDGIPSSAGERTIEPEAFIETMVELRRAALVRETMTVPAAERDRILRERGVTAEELMRFVEVHGRNVPLMARVWGHIEQRLNESSTGEVEDQLPGSLAPPGTGADDPLPPAVTPGALDPS